MRSDTSATQPVRASEEVKCAPPLYCTYHRSIHWTSDEVEYIPPLLEVAITSWSIVLLKKLIVFEDSKWPCFGLNVGNQYIELPENQEIPSAKSFAECFLSGTRRITYMPSAERKTLGTNWHSVYNLFAECSIRYTRKSTPSALRDTRQTKHTRQIGGHVSRPSETNGAVLFVECSARYTPRHVAARAGRCSRRYAEWSTVSLELPHVVYAEC